MKEFLIKLIGFIIGVFTSSIITLILYSIFIFILKLLGQTLELNISKIFVLMIVNALMLYATFSSEYKYRIKYKIVGYLNDKQDPKYKTHCLYIYYFMGLAVGTLICWFIF